LERNASVGLVCADVVFFDEQGTRPGRAFTDARPRAGMVLADIFTASFLGTLTVVARRECFDDVGMFDETITAAEDHDMWLRISEGDARAASTGPRVDVPRAKALGQELAAMSTVTAIIPTYNRAALLPRAIRSVLAQTHRPLELIVVDDGSSDGTEAVVGGFGDPSIRYIRHPRNQGQCAAINTGILEIGR